MRRRAAMALATSALVWLAVPSTPASAGGGSCHAPMTQGKGDAVVISDGCFTPGILRVAPGATVAFSNDDPYVHNVSANGWGHLEGLGTGEGFTATFEAPGVYPFACTLHPGMTGAVVVGDGTGSGNGAVVEVGSLAVPEEEAPAVPADARPVASTRPAASPVGWALAGAVGLALGLGVGVVAARRRGRA